MPKIVLQVKTKQIEIEGISLTLLTRCNGLETNEETSQELTFEITEQEEAKFEQADQTGLDLWTEAVKFLCSHLKSNLHFLLREAFSLSEKESFADEKGTNPGKRFPILELGAGLAVPSLFLSKVSSATENIVSDVDCIALNLAQLNAEMNSISKAHFKTISIDWTDFEINSLSFIPKFIIGSDLLYSSNSVYPIVDFLQKYIPKGGLFLLSHEERHTIYLENGEIKEEEKDEVLILFLSLLTKFETKVFSKTVNKSKDEFEEYSMFDRKVYVIEGRKKDD